MKHRDVFETEVHTHFIMIITTAKATILPKHKECDGEEPALRRNHSFVSFF